MYDLKLNSSHEIDISDSNDFQVVEGIDRVYQQIKVRLLTFLGEWFLDDRVGIPWIEDILIKNPNSSHIKAMIYDQIVEVEGVKEVISIDIYFETKEREMNIQFKVSTTYGELKGEVKRVV